MAEKSQKQMIYETHQAMFGVGGSEDTGLVGDVKEIKNNVKIQNGRIDRLEARVSRIYGMIAGAALVGGGIGAGIGRLFGS